MKDLDTMYTDATCYESEMRYPTDQKLLWECVEKTYKIMCELSGRMGVRRPRTKFLDVEKANLSYRKQRKHSNSQTRKMTRRLLSLLGKILKEIRRMEREDGGGELLTVKEKSLVDIVTKAYRQQHNHFDSGNRRESIPDRIVSVSKEVQQHHGGRDLVHREAVVQRLQRGDEAPALRQDAQAPVRCGREEDRRRRGLCRHGQPQLLQGERHPDLVCQERSSFPREEGAGLCASGAGEGEGHCDGRLVRHPEGALRDAADQGEEERDGDPVHLLRNPHRQRGPPSGATGTTESGSGLVRPPTRFREGVLSVGLPASHVKNTRLSTKLGGYKHYWLQKTEQNRPFWATSKNQTAVLVRQIELNDIPYFTTSFCIALLPVWS